MFVIGISSTKSIHHESMLTPTRLLLPNLLLRQIRPSSAHDVGIFRPLHIHDDDCHSPLVQGYRDITSPIILPPDPPKTLLNTRPTFPGTSAEKPTASASVAFFFLFMLIFGASVNCIPWVYGPEILPLHVRAKGYVGCVPHQTGIALPCPALLPNTLTTLASDKPSASRQTGCGISSWS